MFTWQQLAADNVRTRWSTPWRWCSVGAGSIALGYVSLACLLWLETGDIEVADVIYGSLVVGWMLLAVAIYLFGAEIEAYRVSWERASLSAATFAVVSFSVGSVVYIVLLNRTEAFQTLLRWYLVPVFAGWVALVVAALLMSASGLQKARDSRLGHQRKLRDDTNSPLVA
jgi:hypothetical protein